MPRRVWLPYVPAALAGASLASHGCGLEVRGTAADGGGPPVASEVAAPPGPEGAGDPAAGGVSGEAGGTGDAGQGAGAGGAPPVQPCAPTVVCGVVESTTVLDVAVTQTALFWLDSSGSIRTAAPDGSGARTIVSGEQAPLAGIEADAQSVYWTAGGKVRRARASDGAGATSIADVQGGCLAWMDAAMTTLLAGAPGAGAVYAVGKADGARSAVVTGAVAPWGVAPLAGSQFFYTNYDPNDGRIRKQDGDPNTVNPTLAQGQRGPRCIATDGTSLWWANRESGTLVKSTLTGQSVQAVVSNQPMITGVALDAAYVYWSFQSGIRRRTK